MRLAVQCPQQASTEVLQARNCFLWDPRRRSHDSLERVVISLGNSGDSLACGYFEQLAAARPRAASTKPCICLCGCGQALPQICLAMGWSGASTAGLSTVQLPQKPDRRFQGLEGASV